MKTRTVGERSDAELLQEYIENFQASGQTLQHPSQLEPFATTPEQQSAVKHWIEKFQSMSAEEQAEALRQLQRPH
jgi:hypothetical protein